MTALDLSHDAFLGGQLHLYQPRTGYRAGVDPVLLAASVTAKPGQSVLELGCGAGAAILCLGARVPGLQLTGLEMQENYADLARRNATENDIALDVVTGDLADMPGEITQHRFDHVIANPPYFDRTAGLSARDPGREAALGEVTPLAQWLRAASRRAAPGGFVHVIHRADKLPDLLAHAMGHLGSIEVQPLAARTGRPASLVLMRGRKGGRAAFRLYAPWILHAGDSHDGDRENYSDRTALILRHGASLPFGG
ncbi:methyltransferase [Pseudohalocynthiibacter aestuariivivens]|nr:methyltransferase [Pseudohalocynthiibacter aestuariivivens]QIE46884.1 methyltransferase [Pseudohalocynthiibacter aestuariivivens]